MTQLKVMTYNLLYGFHDRTHDTLLRHEPRAQAAMAVVRAEAPDLLALTEAAFVGRGGRLVRDDFAAGFGLPHVAAGGLEGDWGNALVSRYPIRKVETVPLGGIHSALRAVVDTPGGPLHVDVVHPSPHIAQDLRSAAMAPLLATLGARHIMLGDFNALSDEDTDYTAEALLAQMAPYKVKLPEKVAADMLDRRLIQSVRAAGLVDALPPSQRVPTIPTRLHRPHATQGARLRIDHIFISPGLRVLQAEVVQRPETDAASDHYPVTATLEW